MPHPALPVPDPDTLVVRHPDGTLALIAVLDPTTTDSPLRRALRTVLPTPQGPKGPTGPTPAAPPLGG
ncbi:hypothetical protein [Streptomyces sp. NPDC058745]|uniref:hypothetical protein n=1 Tax=Streptomyces sp. NPDC058745 TaxID=3346621 RepID=UPI0036CA1DA4